MTSCNSSLIPWSSIMETWKSNDFYAFDTFWNCPRGVNLSPYEQLIEIHKVEEDTNQLFFDSLVSAIEIAANTECEFDFEICEDGVSITTDKGEEDNGHTPACFSNSDALESSNLKRFYLRPDLFDKETTRKADLAHTLTCILVDSNWTIKDVNELCETISRNHSKISLKCYDHLKETGFGRVHKEFARQKGIDLQTSNAQS